ncbi:MAG: metallophosphoesterase [Deltaproteobacteria bacterium]|nr:metallophosphoesterase [Deltaproteobacteria bacterium]
MRWIVIILVFAALFGSVHFYAYLKVKSALDMGKGASLTLALFMGLMVFSPVIVRILERMGMETGPKLLAWLGYTWMGFLFLFFCTSVLLDLWRLIAWVGHGFFQYDHGWWTLSPKGSFFWALAVSIPVGLYAHYEAAAIRTERVTIQSPKIPAHLDRLRIVQVSDIHLGLMVRERRLKRILGKVMSANPDILVSTGDLLDGQVDDISNMIDMFGRVPARYGKFAVLGNHEYYAGVERSIAFTEKAGFKVLRDKTVVIPGMICIAGADDPARRQFGLKGEVVSEEDLLSRVPGGCFTVLLKHRPSVNQASIGLFDLQLSGHTHKGQIFPFSLIVKLFYPIDAGFIPLSNGSFLYVSRGAGTWGPMMRFLAPPEVSVIDLVHGEGERAVGERYMEK